MANLKGCFSHKSDDWATPDFIYWWYVTRCKCFDPCPLHAEFDGLAVPWPENVFCNPPYSDILSFVQKGIAEHKRNHFRGHYIYLLPVRTDTVWFTELCHYGCDIVFIRGRLKFGGSKSGAPFPSMLVMLDGRGPDSRCGFDVDDLHYMKGWFSDYAAS